jgi:hypothetical protein
MKVNITLLMMITLAALAILIDEDEPVFGSDILAMNPWWQAGIAVSVQLTDGCALSIEPTRLADGLGLESAPVHEFVDLSPNTAG